MLTVEKLEAMKPGEVFSCGETKILHPWFKDAVKTCDSEGYATVKFVAVRGLGYHDWAIYHSLSFEKADYLDGTSHLSIPFEFIAETGDKLTNKKDVRTTVECDDAAFALYRF